MKWIVTIIFEFYYLLNALTTGHYIWREQIYEDMPLDHFSIGQRNKQETFDLRYLVNDSWWDSNGGPILFYPGNEGDIEEFANATGIMWDWAPHLKAMLVFAEHRFYGKTMTDGLKNGSFTMPYLKTLTVDQALADFVQLIRWLKRNTTGAANSSVIAFGGSYGGVLAAGLRIKYPHIVNGALASSAPFRQFIGGDAPCYAYAESVTRSFASTAPNCDKVVKKSQDAFLRKVVTVEGRSWINQVFRLCDDSFIQAEGDIYHLRPKMMTAFQYSAQYNYPYEANIVSPLPGWPVREECNILTKAADNDDSILEHVAQAVQIYFNHTGQIKCLSLMPSATANTDKNWIFQTCTELIFRQCVREEDMLVTRSWDEDDYVQKCGEFFDSIATGDSITLNYGVDRIRTASNIIFSNGQLDTWYNSCINEENLKGADPSLIVFDIPNAAHHLDLRASNPQDPKEVKDARERMKLIVSGWIQDANRKMSRETAPSAMATLKSAYDRVRRFIGM